MDIHDGKTLTEPVTSEVNPEYCTSCGMCARVCPYNAITVNVKKKIPAHVNSTACMGCDTCGAECPSGAIHMNHFSDTQILSQIDAMTSKNPRLKTLAFVCNWCSYAGADFAGTSRLQYPTNVRLIRTMCSVRVSEGFLWYAFGNGLPVIFASGCHINDCHYIDANHWTEKRITKMKKKMEKSGIRPERLQLEWVSAAEGARFSEVMHNIEVLRKTVTQEEIEETMRIVSEMKKDKKERV